MELEVNKTNEEEIKKLINDPSINKPSEEEILQYEKEFKEASDEFNTRLYEVTTFDKAVGYIDFILNYIKSYGLWEKHAWMGMIKLEEELLLTKESINSNKEKSLIMSYPAIEFTAYILDNPAGIGLESAKAFEKNYEMYAEIQGAIGEQIALIRKTLKHLQFLQDRYAAALQGMYLIENDAVEAPITEINLDEAQSENE